MGSRVIKPSLDMAKGTIHKTNNFGDLEILSYEGYNSVKVRFIDTGFTTISNTSLIRAGAIKDKLKPSVCGVGIIGDGGYATKINGKLTKVYIVWHSMVQRCYSSTHKVTHPSYEGCSVCDEWLNFQVFAEWFDKNHIEGFELDKDIKIDGNKIYSPSACTFVSKFDNSANASAKRYKFTSPEGLHTDVYNLSAFCRDNNLDIGNMSAVHLGKRTGHKRWTKTSETNLKLAKKVQAKATGQIN